MTTQLAAEPAAPLLLPEQVRARLRVSDRTLFRYAKTGKLRPVHLPGGHRRFRAADVDRLAGELGDLVDELARACSVCLADHAGADCPQGTLL